MVARGGAGSNQRSTLVHVIPHKRPSRHAAASLSECGIAAAERELSGALEERRAAVVAATAALRRAHHRLASAHEEAESLRSEVLPGARKAFDVAEEGYRRGKFEYLAVLEAQRALSDARAQYVEAAAERRLAAVEVERLAGPGPESTVDATAESVPGASSPDVGPARRAGKEE